MSTTAPTDGPRLRAARAYIRALLSGADRTTLAEIVGAVSDPVAALVLTEADSRAAAAVMAALPEGRVRALAQEMVNAGDASGEAVEELIGRIGPQLAALAQPRDDDRIDATRVLALIAAEWPLTDEDRASLTEILTSVDPDTARRVRAALPREFDLERLSDAQLALMLERFLAERPLSDLAGALKCLTSEALLGRIWSILSPAAPDLAERVISGDPRGPDPVELRRLLAVRTATVPSR